jgi:murein L,D-transpeptidase YcbB/YkuD
MSTRAIVAAACLALLWCGLSAPAAGQGASSKSARAIQLDAGPSTGAPDPLAPPDVMGPAPAAPGAPATSTDATVAENVDPIVVQVRERLSATAQRSKGGEREDYDGLVAYYARAGQPIWTGKDGLTGRAVAVIGEIHKADDWGLKTSAFELPAVAASPTTEALAEAEIKLGTAVLKYARHARCGRVDPSSISRMMDQKPVIYDPASVLAAVAASSAVDAYLRDLHPKHPQFERLRRAMLLARAAGTRRRRRRAREFPKAPRSSPVRITPRSRSCASGWRCRPATPRRRPTTPRWSMRSRPTRASTPLPPAAPSTTPRARRSTAPRRGRRRRRRTCSG